MPIFKRSDGDLVRGEPPVRRIMPYLMRRRGEACVFQESVYRIRPAKEWLEAYNCGRETRATLFHLLAYACAVTLQARPRLNRFVSGGRLYQRRGVHLSFVVKTAFTDEAPGATVKMRTDTFPDFPAFSAWIQARVGDARRQGRKVDKEVALIMRLPGLAVSWLVGFARLLDRWNLFPDFMTRDDPMFASAFLANLGSVGVSDVFHHLYEYGTVSIFGAISEVRPTAFPAGTELQVEEGLSIRWTFDERIDDGFSCARSLTLVQAILENPAEMLGPPDGTPRWDGTKDPARRP